MITNRPRRGLIALSASAVAAVYIAGFLHTQSADATIGSQDTAASVAIQAAAPMPAVGQRQITPGDPSRGGRDGGAGVRTTQPTPPPVVQQAPPVAQQPPAQQLNRTPPVARGSNTAPLPPAGAPSNAAAAAYKDGTYTGTGTSRRGDVTVTVTVAGSKISDVTISHYTTQYPIRVIAGLPAQVVQSGGTRLNGVSGATYSSSAFAQAVQQALAKARA